MGTRWLDEDEIGAWVRFIAVVELLPGVLDSQLRRDSALTHYEYFVMAMLSEAPDRTLRMTALAARTNATLPRLSHVVSRMEQRGLVRRSPCPGDRRASNVGLTEAGWDAIVAAAPGHVETVRRYVVDALSAEQIGQLSDIATAILERLDPQGVTGASRRRREAGDPPDDAVPDGAVPGHAVPDDAVPDDAGPHDAGPHDAGSGHDAVTDDAIGTAGAEVGAGTDPGAAVGSRVTHGA